MQYRTTSYTEGVFDTYWFEKNLQGDIVAVYNDAGTLLVTYTYDAWGYLLSTKYYNSGSGTAVQYNPFRYRGYYRDSETGFYYLNSRYYDPSTGRFINADVYTSTGQGLLGNNMYAYCNNNPIMFFDPQGTALMGLARENYWQMSLYGGGNFVWWGRDDDSEESWMEQLVNWVTNRDSQNAERAEHIAMYKGAVVVKHSIPGLSSWQLGGIIFLNNDAQEGTIDHEYGHFVHEKMIGTPAYLSTVAVPSVLHCGMDMLFDNIDTPTYYSLPWEQIAEQLGGATSASQYKSYAEDLSILYFIYTTIVP